MAAKIDDAGDLCRTDRLFRGAIRYQLHTREEPLAADIADDLVVHQSSQPVEQVGAGRRRSVGKPFGFHDLDVAQGDSGRDRVAAVCIDDQRARK